ncbi:B151 [miniopterid betaherpesvirus 1]|uniref:B151 n=1 Tax=miniopterid betaherpesvirus 1 TaxID=3070189 RepID=I3VQF3_9BETA|nr:B151 [miniopterid betaherpesvirus 1]AFK83997.1 B151 [miniopterid betaherpesvirus 1]
MWWYNWEKPRPLADGWLPGCYCHTTRRAFLRVMEDFKEIFISQADRRALETLVNDRSGTLLSLGAPCSWYLELQPASNIAEFSDNLLEDVIPESETVTVLGRCVILRVADVCEEGERRRCQKKGSGSAAKDRATRRDTGLVALLGKHTRFYLYDTVSDCLTMAARNIDELARFGLLMAECIYRNADVPYATVHPQRTVSRILRHSNDIDSMVSFLLSVACTDIVLHTPGVRGRPMKLLGDFRMCRRCWPFAGMSDEAFRELRTNLTLRLCCKWYPLGAVGAYRSSGFFHVSHLVLIDLFGAVYSLEIRDGRVYRAADDIHEFFKGGFVRVSGSRRLDHPLRRAARLERPFADDSHEVGYPFVNMGNSNDRDLHYRWLCREDRFRADMLRTWDNEDAFAQKARGPPEVMAGRLEDGPHSRAIEAIRMMEDNGVMDTVGASMAIRTVERASESDASPRPDGLAQHAAPAPSRSDPPATFEVALQDPGSDGGEFLTEGLQIQMGDDNVFREYGRADALAAAPADDNVPVVVDDEANGAAPPEPEIDPILAELLAEPDPGFHSEETFDEIAVKERQDEIAGYKDTRRSLEKQLAECYDLQRNISLAEVEARRVSRCKVKGGDYVKVFDFKPYNR